MYCCIARERDVIIRMQEDRRPSIAMIYRIYYNPCDAETGSACRYKPPVRLDISISTQTHDVACQNTYDVVLNKRRRRQ